MDDNDYHNIYQKNFFGGYLCSIVFLCLLSNYLKCFFSFLSSANSNRSFSVSV